MIQLTAPAELLHAGLRKVEVPYGMLRCSTACGEQSRFVLPSVRCCIPASQRKIHGAMLVVVVVLNLAISE
jgi:hypothetical protein